MILSKPMAIVKRVLTKRGEVDLAFLFGKRREEISYMKLKKPKTSGFIGRSLAFIYFLLRNSAIRGTRLSKKADILIYAGTNNQLTSLLPSIRSAKGKDLSYVLIINKEVSRSLLEDINYEVIKFSARVVVLSILLMFKRGISLYTSLKKQGKSVEAEWHFNEFLRCYPYLIEFSRCMLNVKPKVFISSNDHNVPNRSGLFVSKELGIKSVYMQHASVSFLFPPLEFDYALLDGEKALETYEECVNYKQLDSVVRKNVENTQIYLTGQKKQVEIVNSRQSDTVVFGIAVNSIDDFDSVKDIIVRITKSDYKVLLRTHPYQSQKFIDRLRKLCSEISDLEWSNSRTDSLVKFFSSIDILLAGNSSIHLEAAIAGIRTFYIEMSAEVLISDYYCYAKQGVSRMISSDFIASEILKESQTDNQERELSIRNYSATYHTKWQFKEGELVAEILERILSNASLEELFKLKRNKHYKLVGYLNEI